MRKGVIKRIDRSLADLMRQVSIEKDISERQASREIANVFSRSRSRRNNELQF